MGQTNDGDKLYSNELKAKEIQIIDDTGETKVWIDANGFLIKNDAYYTVIKPHAIAIMDTDDRGRVLLHGEDEYSGSIYV